MSDVADTGKNKEAKAPEAKPVEEPQANRPAVRSTSRTGEGERTSSYPRSAAPRSDSYRGNRGGGGRDYQSGGSRYRVYFRKKVCKFCANRAQINYLDSDALRRFTTARGKILPRRITGTCAKHQRQLAQAIKRARVLAMLPFVAK